MRLSLVLVVGSLLEPIMLDNTTTIGANISLNNKVYSLYFDANLNENENSQIIKFGKSY